LSFMHNFSPSTFSLLSSGLFSPLPTFSPGSSSQQCRFPSPVHPRAKIQPLSLNFVCVSFVRNPGKELTKFTEHLQLVYVCLKFCGSGGKDWRVFLMEYLSHLQGITWYIFIPDLSPLLLTLYWLCWFI
jgi:hypothetical protein